VISNSYTSGVASAVTHLPESAAATVKSGVGPGVAVATKLGSSSLADTVRTAFVHGMDLMLWTCGGIAVACALLAVVVLRQRATGDGGTVGATPAPAAGGAATGFTAEASSLPNA
jgi:hypothetical protein